ncbi:glutathione S-transferase, partial [Pseudoalteromonas sp. S1650]
HSLFAALSNEMAMNMRAIRPVEVAEPAKNDKARLDERLSPQQQRYPYALLFGEFYIVDAMFEPVVLRFKTYQFTLYRAAQD